MTAQGRVGKCHFQSTIPIKWPLKAVMSQDTDPTVEAPELIVHSPENHEGVVIDVALSCHERYRQDFFGN